MSNSQEQPDHSDICLSSGLWARVYRASNPDYPTIYRRGEVAEAAPTVPGWTVSVDDLFA